jgi:hypothetical protein
MRGSNRTGGADSRMNAIARPTIGSRKVREEFAF